MIFSFAALAGDAAFDCSIGEDQTSQFFMYSIESEDDSIDRLEFSFLNFGLITLNDITRSDDGIIELLGKSSEDKVKTVKLRIKELSDSDVIYSELLIQTDNESSEYQFNLNCKEI